MSIDTSFLRHSIVDALRGVPVLGFRLWLGTPGVFATVPGLRGAWGHCLRQLDSYVYRSVLRVHEAGDSQASPRFVLRPAPPDPLVNPAIDVFYFGSAIEHSETLLRAWFEASRFGLRPAPDQPRIPFTIQHVYGLDANGATLSSAGDSRPFRLSQVTSVEKLRRLEKGRCSLVFPTTTCIRKTKTDYQQAKQRSNGVANRQSRSAQEADDRYTLHQRLDIQQVALAVVGRLRSYHLEPHAVNWKRLRSDISNEAADIASSWHGEDFDLVKPRSPLKFKRQESIGAPLGIARDEEVEVRYGIRGRLDLPQGLGGLASLVKAGTWLHIGKGFVEGLGQYEISPQPSFADPDSDGKNLGILESTSAEL